MKTLAGQAMTTGNSAISKAAWLGLIVLTLLFGLCTIFALATTAPQAWQEHVQLQWPQATAHVDQCAMLQSSAAPKRFYIRCSLSYAAGTEQNTVTVYSLHAYPSANGILAEWVDEHPQGTPILVRYDPADHAKVILLAPLMPGGGPRTPHNIKLLEFFGAGFLVLALIAALTRPRTPWRSGYSSVPLNS
jgi:hypothetical protein